MAESYSSPQPCRPDFPVVGLGASAGGIAALITFFQCMPAASGMAFVIVLHDVPEEAGQFPPVLRNATTIPVVEVENAVRIQADHIYVIAPSSELRINHGYLKAGAAEPPAGPRIVIDRLFRTLAQAYGGRAIGVVLSGTGSDGALGLSRIKELGGITLSQTPEDAEHDSMPRSALATGLVDFALPVTDLPQKILDLWQAAQQLDLHSNDEFAASNDRRGEKPRARPGEATAEKRATTISRAALREEQQNTDIALREIVRMMRSRTSHDLSQYKRAMILQRVERRMQMNGVRSLADYREFLHVHPDEVSLLFQDMLTSVTSFFRDEDVFAALERSVLPALFENIAPGGSLRAWSAGCATGEEAYSLAILLDEAAASQKRIFQMFATDIDERAITVARAGSYLETVAGDLSPERLGRYFVQEEASWRIRKELREKILFALHNVLNDPPFSRLDLICCRNLLMYLDRDAQAQVLRMFHFALRPGGMLILGPSESIDATGALFTVVDKTNRIFCATPNPATASLSALPFGTANARPVVRIAKPADGRRRPFADIHQRMLDQFAPPSVLITRASDIVHLSDGAGHFLRYAGGEPSHNLVSVVRPELQMELRTAIFQATQTNRSIEARRVRIVRNGRPFHVGMIVRPVHDPETDMELLLVLLDEVEDSLVIDELEAAEGATDPASLRLEREAHILREQLRSTIDQSEASTEELRASNEELQAMNEELRSTTEELEMGREALQSMNEELSMVNSELHAKVEETAKINDDLHNLIASSDICTIFVDRHMHIRRFTPRAADIFNIIPTDLGRSLLDLTHRLEYDGLAKDANETFASLRRIEREVRSKDGRWYLARITPYRTTQDRIDGAVLAFVEITDRHRTEELLQRNAQATRHAAETNEEYCIIGLGEDARVVSWNAGAARMFGYAQSEIMQKPFSVLFTPEDRNEDMPGHEIRRALKDGRVEEERWHLRKDGSRIYCSGVLARMDDQNVQGFVQIAREVSPPATQTDGKPDSRGYEATVSETERRRDEFLAVVSHELKNPLNLVHANAELLARSPEAATSVTIARVAETIRRTVLSQAQIIDDLMDMSRVRTGKLNINCAAIDWRETIERICHAIESETARKGIALRCELPAAPLVIHADLTRVEQIVWNLLSNALKFTDRGGKIVVTLEQDHDHAVLHVLDTGVGIDPQLLPSIFDMYQQAASAAASKSGLGIGLSLVRQLAALHGGYAKVHSDGRGTGARFSVALPLRHDGALPCNTITHDTGSVNGIRILLVDDHGETLDAFKALLEIQGATVHCATSGSKAIELAKEHEFDVLLSDLGMRTMDGFELVEQIRGQALTADLPAIAMSGWGRAADVQRALNAGFSAHVRKPVSMDQLVVLVRKLSGLSAT